MPKKAKASWERHARPFIQREKRIAPLHGLRAVLRRTTAGNALIIVSLISLLSTGGGENQPRAPSAALLFLERTVPEKGKVSLAGANSKILPENLREFRGVHSALGASAILVYPEPVVC